LYLLEDHIGGFMDIFSSQSARRMGDQNVLHKVDGLMDWSAILEMLKNGLKRSGLGPQGYKEIILFNCLLIGQWHNLSDPKLEQSLRVRFDFMLFSGLDLYGSVPDETTYCRFRNALVNAGAYDALLAEACRQIENHRLKVKEAAAAIIDAT
jgi:IS5 family transposase